MDGVLVVDKPSGLTSHDVVAIARRRLGQRRIGHTGTLDPLATGVLALACGRATRLVRFLASTDKDYRAGIRFGLSTDTYDVEGTPVTCSGLTPTRAAVEDALDHFRGRFQQVPPIFSAKKVEGRRAYALARQDHDVRLSAVPVHVARVTLVDFTGTTAWIELTASAGFYVRSFAHSLGEQVGTGACLESLRRTRSGEFSLDHAVSLEALQADPPAIGDKGIPLERLLLELPSARISAEGRRRVSHGRTVDADHVLTRLPGAQVPGPTAASPGEVHTWVRLLDEHGLLVAVAKAGASPGTLHPSVVLT